MLKKVILLKKPWMQDAEISSKLKELSQSNPFSFRLQAFSSYTTPQTGYFQQNHMLS